MMRRLPNLLRFQAVAEEKTITAAANRLGITQSGLTKSIRQLEVDLGSVLFDRHARGMALTPQGEKLLAHVRVIERECHFAETELAAYERGEHGRLRVGAGPLWGFTLLPGVIARTHAAFPGVRIDLEISVSSVMHPKLTTGDIDLVIGTLLSESGGLPPFLEEIECRPAPIQVFTRADHPLQRRPPTDMAPLLDYPWAIYQEDRELLARINATMKELTGRVPEIAVSCSSLLSTMRLVAEGRYVACVGGPLVGPFSGFDIRPIETLKTIWTLRRGLVFRRSLRSVQPFVHLLGLIAEQVGAAVDPTADHTVPRARPREAEERGRE